MTLDKSVIHFEPGKPNRQDVVIKNDKDKPLYIKVTPYSILNPGTDKQSREKITNPKKSGLLVSPNKRRQSDQISARSSLQFSRCAGR